MNVSRKHLPEIAVPAKKSSLWVITFADLVLLLMAFFILLYSFSQIDKSKYKELNASLKTALGQSNFTLTAHERKTSASYGIEEEVSEAARQQQARIEAAKNTVSAIKEALKASKTQHAATVEQVNHIVVIRLVDSGTFPPGSAVLADKFKPILQQIGGILKTVQGDIVVSGYTDDIPIRNQIYRSNWELSAARAYSVIIEMTETGGLDPERIVLRGFGEHHPLVPNSSPENRLKNRRVDITVDNGQINYDLKVKKGNIIEEVKIISPADIPPATPEPTPQQIEKRQQELLKLLQ